MAFSQAGTTGFPITSTTPTFGGFGSTAAPSFGGTVTTVSKAPAFSTTGFAFGNPSTGTTTTATTSGFGFTGFGAGTTAATTTASTGFAFGGQPGGSLFSGLGTQSTGTTPAFGGFSSFGAKPTTTTASTGFGGFGSFGSTTGFGSSFGTGLGQPQQLQLQPAPEAAANPLEALYNAVFNCNVYGDERDSTLARWNLLQALWGTGKGFYSQRTPPVEFTLQNPLCRFKAIGYSCIPMSDNKEGLVAISFNKKEEDIKDQQNQLKASLMTILGNNPNVTLEIETIRPTSDTKAQVIIYAQEKGLTGSLQRIPATDLVNYLLQPTQKQQLSQLGVENVYPQIKPDKEQLDEYLANAPAGIDPRLWKQARLDNPNPERYIPVPMVGFAEVQWRLKCQERETRLHQRFLERVGEDIAALQRRHATTLAKIVEHRRRFIDLEHRVLEVLVKQEVSRKLGLALQPEEEALRGRLESLQVQLSAPTQFKARLNELLSQMRTHSLQLPNKDVERYSMDPGVQEDIKQFLLLEQNGMAHLIDIIQNDLASLKIIKEGLSSLLQTY